MSLITRIRKQKAVLWEADGIDQYTKPKFKQPVEIDCRWEDERFEEIDAEGQTVTFDSRVFVGQVIPVGSRIMLGEIAELNSPNPPPNSRRVRRMSQIPNKRASETLLIAML